MLRLVEVQPSLPDRIAGTEIHHLGDEPPDVWYAWDEKECAWYCRDIDGEVVFVLSHLDLVCISHLYLDWSRCSEDPHRVRMNMDVYGGSTRTVLQR